MSLYADVSPCGLYGSISHSEEIGEQSSRAFQWATVAKAHWLRTARRTVRRITPEQSWGACCTPRAHW